MNPIKTKTTAHVPRSMCGRTGCVAIYTTENCHLCEAAGKYLKELIKAEGLKEDIINVIDNEFQLNERNFDVIQSRPAIRVCETVMTGLPDEEKMK
ncbi:MAG: glutaredoxin family protein, partial [Candidatus Thorarchaeota archaeon]|nr:glutaredoxin family protein [Candidatus Thorarchaeota archaeon]